VRRAHPSLCSADRSAGIASDEARERPVGFQKLPASAASLPGFPNLGCAEAPPVRCNVILFIAVSGHMRYTDPLSFSFDLPDGWRHHERVTPLTFFGPTGDIGRQVEVIQLKVDISPLLQDRDYTQPEAREAPSFWGEQEADTFRSNLGCETNVVVLQRASCRGADVTVDRRPVGDRSGQ
jgi:hypothetical protein